jgi:hypothetical protein
VLGFLAAGGAAYAGVVFLGATDPKTLNPGYQPVQPVPFSHKIHAGQLKMDCRYCHTSVEKAAHASVPPTSTCINCHSPLEKATGTPALAAVHPDSPKLKALHESWESGNSVPWTRIHRLPDFVYFNHAAHISRGVSCVTCHDRIDKMEVVYQAKELSMTWCVDCHRNPEPHLRPTEFVTKLDWKPEDGTDPAVLGAQLKKEKNINPLANCAVCHR